MAPTNAMKSKEVQVRSNKRLQRRVGIKVYTQKASLPNWRECQPVSASLPNKKMLKIGIKEIVV